MSLPSGVLLSPRQIHIRELQQASIIRSPAFEELRAAIRELQGPSIAEQIRQSIFPPSLTTSLAESIRIGAELRGSMFATSISENFRKQFPIADWIRESMSLPSWGQSLAKELGLGSSRSIAGVSFGEGFRSLLPEKIGDLWTQKILFEDLATIAAVERSLLLSENEIHQEFDEEETQNIETATRIIVASPAIAIIQALARKSIALKDLGWRQFEELIGQLLEDEGYKVQMGRGSKDNGMDIWAETHLPGMGRILSVWQAKHLKGSNKVGIDVVRELADTRNEMKASKGVIVTSTKLTRGALCRVNRDKHILEKVDGDDLYLWLSRSKHT